MQRPIEFTQYTAVRYAERLGEVGAMASVGTTGDSYDNALAETTIGLLKSELLDLRKPWRGLRSVEFALLGYIEWFNTRRIHHQIGGAPQQSSRLLTTTSTMNKVNYNWPELNERASRKPGEVHWDYDCIR